MGGREQAWHCYRHSGLLVRSQIELPEWAGFACGCNPDAADVEIVIDCNSAESYGADGMPCWDGTVLSFTAEGVGHWSISGGNCIRVTAFPSAGEAELRLFTLGSAWGALGYQRGFLMLHGSAVGTSKGTLLFCGAQEAGKSTMAAAMAQRGHRLLVDDLSRVEPPMAGRPARIYPVSNRLKLWQPAIDHFGWHERVLVRDHFRDAKYHLRTTEVLSATSEPLSAIVLLSWGSEFSLERIVGSEAVRSVIAAATYRPEMLDTMGLQARQAAMVAAIVASVPVYRLNRPCDFTILEQLCVALEAL